MIDSILRKIADDAESILAMGYEEIVAAATKTRSDASSLIQVACRTAIDRMSVVARPAGFEKEKSVVEAVFLWCALNGYADAGREFRRQYDAFSVSLGSFCRWAETWDPSRDAGDIHDRCSIIEDAVDQFVGFTRLMADRVGHTPQDEWIKTREALKLLRMSRSTFRRRMKDIEADDSRHGEWRLTDVEKAERMES